MNRPVRFRISSSSVMNSFYVPALSGQIYAMPGMETKLHGVFDETGEYEGFSANYSGWGFSNMRFAVKSLPAGEFDQWVAATKASAEGDLKIGRAHVCTTVNNDTLVCRILIEKKKINRSRKYNIRI